MHIGIEAQRVLRPKRHGMDVVALQLIRSLLAADRENQYTVYLDRPDTEDELGTWDNLTKRVLRAPSYPLWEQVALPAELARRPVDLLHLTSNTAPLLSPVPTLITLHDVIFMGPQLGRSRSLYQRLGRVYRRWNVPRASRRARQLVTVSSYERERILDTLALPPEQVSVVYNAVGDTFSPTPAPADAEIRTQLGARDPYLLFLGNHAPKKNTDRVLDAWLRLRRGGSDVSLVIIELSLSEVRARLQRLGAEAADLEAVVCPGYVSHPQLAALYRGASAFLYPSLAESFGLPILEAMASGTPTITSNCTGGCPQPAAFICRRQNATIRL